MSACEYGGYGTFDYGFETLGGDKSNAADSDQSPLDLGYDSPISLDHGGYDDGAGGGYEPNS